MKRHIDLFSELRSKTGQWLSLDELAELNVGVRKKKDWSSNGPATVAQLKAYCRRDVLLTFKLFSLYRRGKLKCVHKAFAAKSLEAHVGSCSFSKQVGSLVEIQLDVTSMSDSEEADYQNGQFQHLRCTECGNRFLREAL